jgi:hypothetical protein
MLVRCCRFCSKKFSVDFESSKKTCCTFTCRKNLNAKLLTSHGESDSRLYGIWCGIKSRCNSLEGYIGSRYKNRGIKICKLWNDSFEEFKKWSIKNGYKQNLEIDRKDGNKGYYPNNCRWVTKQQQSYNRGKRQTKCTSKYKGVSLTRPGVWRVQINVNKKHLYCGCFRNELEAAKEYDKQAVKYHGEFAALNFPDIQGGVSS